MLFPLYVSTLTKASLKSGDNGLMLRVFVGLYFNSPWLSQRCLLLVEAAGVCTDACMQVPTLYQAPVSNHCIKSAMFRGSQPVYLSYTRRCLLRLDVHRPPKRSALKLHDV